MQTSKSGFALWLHCQGATVASLRPKGIESAEDICALNAAGVDLGQGFFLGSPDANPADGLNLRARQALESGWAPIDVSTAAPRAFEAPSSLRH